MYKIKIFKTIYHNHDFQIFGQTYQFIKQTDLTNIYTAIYIIKNTDICFVTLIL